MPEQEIAFTESPERQALRKSVADFATKYGEEYWLRCAREGRKTDELWADAGRRGYLGVAIPEAYGGGGGGIGDLAAVAEELQAAGCPLLLIVVSPAICGSLIGRFGTPEQKKRWLPGIADGTRKMAFAITEPDAGSNSHNIRTTARRDESTGEWILKGGKVFISGVDEASDVLVVARTVQNRTGNLRPALFVIPTDSEGFSFATIDMGIVGPEKQFLVHLDDVRLPADALVGHTDAGIGQLFAGRDR